MWTKSQSLFSISFEFCQPMHRGILWDDRIKSQGALHLPSEQHSSHPLTNFAGRHLAFQYSSHEPGQSGKSTGLWCVDGLMYLIWINLKYLYQKYESTILLWSSSVLNKLRRKKMILKTFYFARFPKLSNWWTKFFHSTFCIADATRKCCLTCFIFKNETNVVFLLLFARISYLFME